MEFLLCLAIGVVFGWFLNAQLTGTRLQAAEQLSRLTDHLNALTTQWQDYRKQGEAWSKEVSEQVAAVTRQSNSHESALQALGNHQ